MLTCDFCKNTSRQQHHEILLLKDGIATPVRNLQCEDCRLEFLNAPVLDAVSQANVLKNLAYFNANSKIKIDIVRNYLVAQGCLNKFGDDEYFSSMRYDSKYHNLDSCLSLFITDIYHETGRNFSTLN